MSHPADIQYPVQQVLELACAAQRLNGSYLKTSEPIYTDDNVLVGYKFDNKTLVKAMVNPTLQTGITGFNPPLLCTTQDDVALAAEIKSYYRRLMFSAIEGENEFQTTVNSLLNSETTTLSYFGYIACLPNLYDRDSNKSRIRKTLKECDNAILADVDTTVEDKDCEIVEVRRSKNFDAWNILAIIDNKIVSWFSKKELILGPAVVIKGKVKGLGENWTTKKIETRLNYVKVVQ